MYDPTADLMRTLADGIEADETFADNFASLASYLDEHSEGVLADALARHGRRHRAKAITLRAHLGALVDAYGPLHVEQS